MSDYNGQMAAKRLMLQMEALRMNLEDFHGDPIQDNFRPTQELNDREVYYYSGV